MTIDEINAFIANSSKSLVGDVEWKTQVGSRGLKFRQPVQYDNSANREVGLNIWCNLDTPLIEITYFVAGIGRIYGFCLGKSHSGMLYHRHHGIGENEVVTPLPDSIAQLVDNPAEVWAAFCDETSLIHTGTFSNPAREQWLPQAIEI